MSRRTDERSHFASKIIRGRPPRADAKGGIREHYDICPDCGQTVDLREIGELCLSFGME